jgi:hypothetical protein
MPYLNTFISKLLQYQLKTPRYNWNIVESGVKYHKPKSIKNNFRSEKPQVHVLVIALTTFKI